MHLHLNIGPFLHFGLYAMHVLNSMLDILLLHVLNAKVMMVYIPSQKTMFATVMGAAGPIQNIQNVYSIAKEPIVLMGTH
jgi:hypothetical protein